LTLLFKHSTRAAVVITTCLRSQISKVVYLVETTTITTTTKKFTPDPQALRTSKKIKHDNEQKEMVTTRVELATLALLAPRSNQLWNGVSELLWVVVL
jgi:hypothetical protein